MLLFCYGFVILFATFLGASAGLGGGVIIKPMLDFIGAHDLATISFFSTSAVFTMALSSTLKQLRNHVSFDTNMIVLVSLGAMVGGTVGNIFFTKLLELYDAKLVGMAQSIALAGLLSIVLYQVNYLTKSYHIKNTLLTIGIGFGLGVISAFLGIGGGPMNVAVFLFFFGVDLKIATIYSIATILFSQGSKLCTIAFTTGFAGFDLSLLWIILPMAILGGIIGTYVNHHVKESVIKQMFTITVFCIICLNLYNAVCFLN